MNPCIVEEVKRVLKGEEPRGILCRLLLPFPAALGDGDGVEGVVHGHGQEVGGREEGGDVGLEWEMAAAVRHYLMKIFRS